ncbi:zinc ribbon domain-containing protein [Pedobacter sp. V48]|uniref:zinc ribbon domain-containing protein n=1 Tax=Pedobacter sp. V48 TaxID=509635 RepID=UPI001F3A0AAF|nr:zinc ribbon domain-containing protein [Pedobacter sp. V48]
MLPKLPNYIFITLFTLAVGVVSFTYVQISKLGDRESELRKGQTVSNQAATDDLQQLKQDFNFLKQFSQDLSTKYRLQNPIITDRENNLFFNHKLRGTKSELYVDLRLGKLYKDYQTRLANNIILTRKMDLNNDFAGKELFSINEDHKFLKDLQTTALVIILVVVIGLIYNLYLHEKYLESHIEKKNENCQSCFKMLNATVPFATFNDGTPNQYYCAQCFDGLSFTEPHLSCKTAFSRFLAGKKMSSLAKVKYTKTFQNLRRWKMGEY